VLASKIETIQVLHFARTKILLQAVERLYRKDERFCDGDAINISEPPIAVKGFGHPCRKLVKRRESTTRETVG
jgi:hypothetical protein